MVCMRRQLGDSRAKKMKIRSKSFDIKKKNIVFQLNISYLDNNLKLISWPVLDILFYRNGTGLFIFLKRYSEELSI
jgi:hypothetical protein